MSYPWGSDGLDKSRFEAYAKLLRLKNGGQVEEASNFSDMPDEETEFDTPDDADSVNTNIFPLFDERKLKRAFLDRLSELVANEKGGYHVSSSLMIEWPARVDILVARNNGFREADTTLRMLEIIASSLRDISRLASSDPVAISVKQNLWTSLVQSYRPRLNDYMAQAKQALKGIDRSARVQVEALTLADGAPSLLSRLEGICALIDAATRSPTQDGIEKAVQSAHDVYTLYKENDFDEINGSHTDTRSLRDALGYLGRLQTCFHTLTRSAERLSSFQGLRILPVIDTPTGHDKPNTAAPNHAWSLAKTFSSLGLTLGDKTVESVLGLRKKRGFQTKKKMLQKFNKLKAATVEVHAEMRVIVAATKHDCTGASIFRYLGCSKRSCFLCSRALQSYGSYVTRGCHGKLYNLWTVPDLPWLAEEEKGLKLVQALKDVEEAMKESIYDRKPDGLPLAPESTIGGSSVATRRQQCDDNPYTTSLVSDYLRSQRQAMRFTAGKEADFASPNQSLPHGAQHEAGQHEADLETFPPGQTKGRSAKPVSENEQVQGECDICQKETDRRCQFCNLAWFCSEECQDQMRFRHLTKCAARSITTADIFFNDIVEDQLPEDPETREHFGFTRCRDWREQSYLLGVYQGLRHMKVGPVQLNDWRERDILMSRIIETYSRRPPQYRGVYFPWLLRNQHILDNASPPLELHGKDNPLRRALAAARPYLDPEDRPKEFHQLEPPSKRHCFLLYAMALDSSRPNPNVADSDLWYDFGFATCRGQGGEGGLGHLYNRLLGRAISSKLYDQSLGIDPVNYPNLPTCSFNDFWVAYENGSLPQLFRQYGLGSSLGRDDGLSEFLSFPPSQDALRPSIWRLKHFLALDTNAPLGNFPKIEVAVQEYGFTWQLDAGTRLALRQFYEQLFQKVNPLRVHEAKIRGELLECAESSLDIIDDGVRHVLRRLGREGLCGSGRILPARTW